jgi:hypothetical protein
LWYASQRRGAQSRRYLQALKLRLRLNGIASIGLPLPERPRRMHRTTYERLCRRLERLEQPLRQNRRFTSRETDYSPWFPNDLGTFFLRIATLRRNHAEYTSACLDDFEDVIAQREAPPPSGVHPLPQHHRGAGTEVKGDPRHRRQLCHPQTSQGARMACLPSPLDLPLHPDLRILAQRRRGLFAKLTRRRLMRGIFRSVDDLKAAINRFVAQNNADPKPFIRTADPRRVLAAVKRGKQALESVH